MTPDDVLAVQRSWSELRGLRAPLQAALTRRFEAGPASSVPAAVRSDWLLAAVDELVELLPAPSRLAARAGRVGATWPDALTAPCCAVEGQAWVDAARECLPTWSAATDTAWRQAWVLLTNVLAAETLSPFCDGAT